MYTRLQDKLLNGKLYLLCRCRRAFYPKGWWHCHLGCLGYMLPILGPQHLHTGSGLQYTSSADLVVGGCHWHSHHDLLCWHVHSGVACIGAGIPGRFHVHVWVGVWIQVVVSVWAHILAVFVVTFRVATVMLGHVVAVSSTWTCCSCLWAGKKGCEGWCTFNISQIACCCC